MAEVSVGVAAGGAGSWGAKLVVRARPRDIDEHKVPLKVATEDTSPCFFTASLYTCIRSVTAQGISPTLPGLHRDPPSTSSVFGAAVAFASLALARSLCSEPGSGGGVRGAPD